MISFGYVVILFLIVEVVQALQSSGEERKNSSTYVLFSIQKKKNYVTVCYFMVCCFKRKTVTCLNRWRFPGSFSSSKNSFSSNDSTKANARQSASNNENFMLPWQLHEFTEDCEIVKASFIQNQKKAELSCKVKQTKYAAALNKTKV